LTSDDFAELRIDVDYQLTIPRDPRSSNGSWSSRANAAAGRGNAGTTVHRVTCRRMPTKSE